MKLGDAVIVVQEAVDHARRRFEALRVMTFPPPGAGRTLVEMLNILSQFPARRRDPDTPEGAVLLAEVIRTAFLDRRDRPFDPNFYAQVEERRMVSADYARAVSRKIRRRLSEKGETTHLSVMDREGNAPLHWAACNGHRDVAELLLAAGADVNAEDHGGDAPLHDAAQGGHAGLVELLLHSGAHVNARDCWGATPLHDAAAAGHEDMFGTCRLCLQFVADHWYMHRGQLAGARRMAGVDRMWF